MGILLGLGVLWLVGDLVHRNKDDQEKQRLTLAHALSRIDMGSIMFFIGILLAVATLEHTGVLVALASWLDRAVGRQDIIVLIIGIASAVVDNVPLVAASMGMYSLAHLSDRPLPVGVPRLLRRHRRLDPDHRLGRRCRRHGVGANPVRLVHPPHQCSGALGYLAGAGTYLLLHQLAG